MMKPRIALIVLAFHVLATSLASGQNASRPATTQESGVTSGKVVAAVAAGERVRHPSRLTYARLYCTPDGNSHWTDVNVALRKIDFAPPAAPIHIADSVPASSTFFGGFEARWGASDKQTGVYHPAPAAQFIVVLDGVFSIIASDGEQREFRPGDVFRVEDTAPCKGHITIVGDKPGFFLFAR